MAGSNYCLLNACLPVPPGACIDHRSTPCPVLCVVSYCSHTSSHSISASWCSKEAEGSQEQGEMKLHLACLSLKLLPSLLHCPWWKREPWALKGSFLGLAYCLTSLHGAPQRLESLAYLPASSTWPLLVFWFGAPAQDTGIGQVLCRALCLARNSRVYLGEWSPVFPCG